MRTGAASVAALLFLLVLGSGCASAPRYTVQISALADEPAAPSAGVYVVLPAKAEKDERDLQFKQFARTVERGLAERGFVAAHEPGEATIVLLLDYGVGDQQTKTITYVRPAYSYYGRYGHGFGYPHRHGRHCGHGYRGVRSGFYDPFFYDTPQTRSYTTFNRYFSIEARRIEPGRAPRDGEPIWATRVESRGRDTDLRAVFPALVAAATQYLGTDTGEAIETRISGDDERVTRLRARPGLESAGATDSD